jgi:hypothetical protein
MVQAAVPEQINYQGRLTDATNVALDGAYLVVFSVWDVDTGGVAALWFEQQTVTVTEGIYNVQLGAMVPFPADLLDGPDRFIQVEIFTTGEGWEVLTPRQPLTSVPFAMRAAQADSTIDGAITTAMLANEAITTEKLVDGAVTAAKVTGGFVPNLDADMLDGLNATSFAPAVHNHDTQYYTKYEVDSLLSGYEERIAALEAKLQYLTVVAGTVNEMPGPHVMITGANLHVRSGSGSTPGTLNGLGNLIVGYNELRNFENDRSGSHNIVVGRNNNYTSFGGLVVGYENTISGEYASVSGGGYNTASEYYASVSGGRDNTASEYYASVSGGWANTASGYYASVSGGLHNTASETSASVSGGRNNTASGDYAFVGGGGGTTATDGNQAIGNYSSILGGFKNIAGDPLLSDYTIGQRSSISGGLENKTTGEGASVGGGWRNTASGPEASVTGGFQNDAQGGRSSVTGGQNNVAGGSDSAVSGGSYNTASSANNSVVGDAGAVYVDSTPVH